MAKGTLAPTGAQLSAAIAEELEISKGTLAVKELQAKLLDHHTDWKIPERRVKKFLKRHLNHHGDPSGADDDATVASVVSKSPGKRLRNFFKIKSNTSKTSSNKNTPESAPIAPLPPTEEEEPPQEEPVVVIEEPPRIEEEPKAAPLEQRRSLVQVYSDDNDGSKKNDCQCSAGEACTIM